jgi:hypothetical protein
MKSFAWYIPFDNHKQRSASRGRQAERHRQRWAKIWMAKGWSRKTERNGGPRGRLDQLKKHNRRFYDFFPSSANSAYFCARVLAAAKK